MSRFLDPIGELEKRTDDWGPKTLQMQALFGVVFFNVVLFTEIAGMPRNILILFLEFGFISIYLYGNADAASDPEA